ncbi:DUF5666 domain-containing protein [Nocardia farcinica]|uniref:DUF5666 domain-containing protein n=1 Tax=Nocardia farcinica TaxID=37329 RepID=UPI0024571A60|nr:DUF5666 domain-containing protein [Nocardia farcinica]
MTNPKDPWGQRPGDAPTEHLGPPGAAGYGEYPPTEQYDPWSAPPSSEATREIPPLDHQWGAYEPAGGWQGEQQRGAWAGAPGQQPGMPYQPGPPGQQPPGVLPPDHYVPPGQGPRKSNTGLWIALGLGVVALIGVVGVAAGLVLGGGDDEADTTAAGSSTATTHTLPFQAAPSTTAPLPGLSGLPGLPELGIEELGATVGTITANDGGTLTIATMTGGDVVVRTDAATQVISLSVLRAADLPVGEMVVVQGEKGSDGTIQARIIVSTALPGGGR